MSDTPLVLKGCMTVATLSLILQYVVHSWSKVKGKGGGGKVHSPPGLEGATHVVVVDPNSSPPCCKINPHGFLLFEANRVVYLVEDFP